MIVGGKPGDEAAVVLRDLMSKRAQIRGSTLRTRPGEEKAALVQEFGAAWFRCSRRASRRRSSIASSRWPMRPTRSDYVREPGKLGRVLLELPG